MLPIIVSRPCLLQACPAAAVQLKVQQCAVCQTSTAHCARCSDCPLAGRPQATNITDCLNLVICSTAKVLYQRYTAVPLPVRITASRHFCRVAGKRLKRGRRLLKICPRRQAVNSMHRWCAYAAYYSILLVWTEAAGSWLAVAS